MMNHIKAGISWLFAVWTSYVFLNSLNYKFKGELEPQHIFSTIGTWMNDVLGSTIGDLFSQFGQYAIGGAELITSLILLSPIFFPAHRASLHRVGAILASIIMAGAVFFHLATPLGWEPTWEVADVTQCDQVFIQPNLCSDTGLAYAALSILILGIIVAIINKRS